MLLNRLKLSKDKTEFLAISSVYTRAPPPLSHIHVCYERALASPKASNIGVLFDESLSIDPQVTAICKSAYYHLCKISLILKYLTFDAPQLLVHAPVTTKTWFNNVTRYYLGYLNTRLNSSNVYRMQLLELLYCFALVLQFTPVLVNLHWLPIKVVLWSNFSPLIF